MPLVPRVLTDPNEVRAACEAARARGERVALVPTMGALHAGHLALVEAAREHASFVVVSIFVNPTQFGPGEDFARYPRDLEGDTQKLSGASLVFAPTAESMYAPNDQTRVVVGELARALCGPFRPGHFEGVATIVTKLFAMAGPCTAVFGEKDYQQLVILRRVAQDLCLPVSVVGHAIVREPSGLAMSSRNAYLTSDERSRAHALSRGLFAAVKAFSEGERGARSLRAFAVREVTRAATSVDYVTLADAETLVPLADEALVERPAVLAIACHVGTTRLIDNAVLRG